MKIYAAILKKFTSAAIIMIATGMLTCSAADTVSLTDEEAAWLSEHPVIRFAIDPDNAPIEWINRKNIERGMSFDMLRLVEERLGIHFERVESAGWIESIQMLQNRDVDILPAFRRAKEWQQQLLFSRPWFSLPGVILSEQKYQTLEELEGRKVAVVHDYIWDDLVSKNDDNLIIIRASDSHRCIDLVVQGGAEAMVGDMASVTWILNRSGATHLRIRPVAGEYLDLSVAIRSDWPLFQHIINKVLDSISQSELDKIEEDWIQLIEPAFWKDPLFQIVTVFIVIIILSIVTTIMFWNRSLQKEVERNAAALEEAAMKLIHAEKMESIGLLAAGIAHEVKNPLAVIQMGIDHLTHQNEGSEITRMTLHDMEHAVRKADGTIRKLLDYSRGTPPDMKAADINNEIRTVLDLISHECHLHQILIEANLTDELPWIVMDTDQIQQLFMNIMLNAVQSMEDEGGGTLSVSSKVKKLNSTELQRDSTGTLSSGDRVVWVEIKDTGHGIDEKGLGKVFDPFYTTRPLGKGTGLGLTVSLNIIRNHDASIDIRNRDERGVSVLMMFRAKEVTEE